MSTETYASTDNSRTRTWRERKNSEAVRAKRNLSFM